MQKVISGRHVASLMRHALAVAFMWLAVGSSSTMASTLTKTDHPLPVAILLDGSQNVIDRDLSRLYWVDESGSLSLDQVVARHGKDFASIQPGANLPLGPGRVLWFHIRLSQVTHDARNWWLEFPMPFLDLVTVYQLDTNANWQWQTSGDNIANADWPASGRFPVFQLELAEGETQDIYVAIRHVLRQPVPMRIASDNAHDMLKQVEYLVLGVIFGAVLLLFASCLIQGWGYRDATYCLYALYPLFMLLTVAAYSGVGGHLLWRHSPVWADAAPGVLGIWASAVSLLFARKICACAARYPRLDRLTLGFGLLALALGFVFLLVERGSARLLIAALTSAVSVLFSMLNASLIWRRGDAVGKLVFVSCLPRVFIAVLAPLQAIGLELFTLNMQYGVVLVTLLNVPLLLMALRLRSRPRHDLHKRKNTLVTHDALTGLLIAPLFEDRLRQTLARAQRHHEAAAVVFLDLVNYEQIKRSHGTAVAEQSLLRCVFKLRRYLRDVDTISRIGDARFGLVMEDVNARAEVMSHASRLIASGLMPLAGLKPEVILRFHFSAVLLGEYRSGYEQLTNGLAQILAQMSPRTRRPIRFLEPQSDENMLSNTNLQQELVDAVESVAR